MKISKTVCSYHKTLNGDGNKFIQKFVKAFDNDAYILFDNQTNLELSQVQAAYNHDNICMYSNKDFELYKFNKPIDKHHRWGSHQNPKYFYAHFRMLVFYLNHPNFDYYWFVDDDIDFTGNIQAFLDNYNSQNVDFLVIQAFKKENYINYPKISVINNRMNGSHGHWLEWCPGPGDKFQNQSIHIGSFFPIVRFSKSALQYLWDLHNQGFYGYSEGFVPTTLASNNFNVCSMMDEFNNFFVPNTTDCALTHKGMRFTWEWL
jgi:hypothetical protein